MIGAIKLVGSEKFTHSFHKQLGVGLSWSSGKGAHFFGLSQTPPNKAEESKD